MSSPMGALIPRAGYCFFGCLPHSCWAFHFRLPFHMGCSPCAVWAQSARVHHHAVDTPPTPTYLDPSPSAGCHSVGHSSSCLSFHPAPDLLCVWIPTRPAHARYPKPGCSRTWRHFSPWVLGPFHDPFLGLSNSLEWPMELRETVTSIYWFTV